MGKTRDQLRSLHFRRDRDWLQSWAIVIWSAARPAAAPGSAATKARVGSLVSAFLGPAG